MMQMSFRNIGIALGLLLLATLPVWMQHPYYINTSSQILFWAIIALGLNVLVGYAGLTSLGHAGLFAITGYAVALLVDAGFGHLTAAIAAIGLTLLATAVFAVLALRATGIGFLMITLALGQIVWGIAYRWVDLTNGDNGVNLKARPMPFGFDLSSPSAFYWATFIAFVVALIAMQLFVRSPFGATVRGTRDQPRRMNALGFNVWLIQFLAFLFSGFWCAIGGLLYIYYNQFVAPPVAGLQSSAELLLMVISGGTGTLLGPIAGAAIVIIIKNVVSAWIERWNLVLGLIFVIIISFMPDGLVPGIRRLWRTMRGTDVAEAAAARAAGKAVSDAAKEKSKEGVQ
jgi:branched-chain amino acid transport system permease protein